MRIGQSNNKNDNLILCQTELSSKWSRTRDGINVLKQRTSPAQYTILEYNEVKWPHCELMNFL